MKITLASKLHIPSLSIQTISALDHHQLFHPDPTPEPAISSPCPVTEDHPSQDLQEDLSLSAASSPTASHRSPSPVYLNEEYDPEHPELFYTINTEGFPLVYHPIGLDNLLSPYDLFSNALLQSDINNNILEQSCDFTASIIDPKQQLSIPPAPFLDDPAPPAVQELPSLTTSPPGSAEPVVQERALNLLRSGSFPLLPPGT